MPIKDTFAKIKRISKMNKDTPYINYYPKYYKRLKIQKNTVLIESTHGSSLVGHMFYIAYELAKNFSHLQVYVAAKDPVTMRLFLDKKEMANIKVVEHLSKDYCKLLTRAKYLINDTTFYPFFIKKKGQKYINIWHGTPLKTLGKDQESITDMANIQRNFYMADKIVTNNEYTQNILADSHHITGIYQGKMVIAPSPRNSVLLDKKVRTQVRQSLRLNNKKVYLYMPTWRGSVGKVENNNDNILKDLKYISRHLKADEYFFVKLHPFQANIDLSEVINIHYIPADLELYEFLTGIDALITDYSSIMYDFLLTNKQIILYMYDKDEYFSTRGVYDDIDRYPFEQASSVEQLVTLLQSPKSSYDYQEMKQEFCPLDHINGTAILCGSLFNQQEHELIKEKNLDNGKETVFILSGGLWDNGITTALLNIFDNIDITKRNYIVLFEKGSLKKEHEFRVKNLPESVQFYPIVGTTPGTLIERAIYRKYMRSEKFNSSWARKIIKRILEVEFVRIFGEVEVDYFIHYTGFERKYAELMKHMPNNVNTIMFCHTDMFMEYEMIKKANQGTYNKKVIFSTYESVSKLVLVHENLREKLVRALPHIEKRIHIMNNFLGEKRIRDLAAEKIASTLCPVNIDYAYVDNDSASKQDFSYATAGQDEFFSSSKTLSSYQAYDINPYLDQLNKIDDNLYEKIVTKIQLLQSLIMLLNLGERKLKLLNDLYNPELTVFINIGRYAHQKGHNRLIFAFEKIYSENKNCRLILVAPHGPLKRETINRARESKAKEVIYILGRMSNPYPLLKMCDAFVLSSYYEGLGLVVYEALAVGTTPITVNLKESTEYLAGNEAIIVENSERGLYQGMKQYLASGDLSHQFDFLSKNKKSLSEFELIFA